MRKRKVMKSKTKYIDVDIPLETSIRILEKEHPESMIRLEEFEKMQEMVEKKRLARENERAMSQVKNIIIFVMFLVIIALILN